MNKSQLRGFEICISVHLKNEEVDNKARVCICNCVVNATLLNSFKVELSPSEKICFICFNENPLPMMKNAFYFILKAFLVLKIFKYLS